jgi:hypothetical protein
VSSGVRAHGLTPSGPTVSWSRLGVARSESAHRVGVAVLGVIVPVGRDVTRQPPATPT